MVAPTVKLGLTQGPFREGAGTEGDWGSMRERVICCCDIGSRRTFTKNSFRHLLRKCHLPQEGGFVVRPYIELSSITKALIFSYCADGRTTNARPYKIPISFLANFWDVLFFIPII